MTMMLDPKCRTCCKIMKQAEDAYNSGKSTTKYYDQMDKHVKAKHAGLKKVSRSNGKK